MNALMNVVLIHYFLECFIKIIKVQFLKSAYPYKFILFFFLNETTFSYISHTC